MPTITEAHVVMLKNNMSPESINQSEPAVTPWEEFLLQHKRIRPEKFQVHLVVSGFYEREDARGFAENFMANGSLFVFNNNKRSVYRLDVASDKTES